MVILPFCFLWRFWHNIVLFIPSLGFSLSRIMPKIWAALPLRGADPHREKFLLVVEVVVRMNGAISDFIAEALGFLYFSSDEFSPDLSGVYSSRFSLLHWKRKIGEESDPQVLFLKARAYRFVFLFCFFEVSRCLNIVVPLRGVHSWFAHSALFQAQLNSCIRLWTHFSFSFCFMEVELDTQWSLRGMRVPTDGSPMKASGTLRLLNSKGWEHALSARTVEHWITAPIKDGLLTELEVEQTPIGALRQCVVFPSGNVNDTCYFCCLWLQMFPPWLWKHMI